MEEKNGQNEFIPFKDWGAAFGYGLFETMRIYHGIPFLLEEHIQRLMNSSRQLFFLNMPDEEQLKQLISRYIKKNGFILIHSPSFNSAK